MYEELVVSDSWLADHLDSVRVVDVRDAWEYEGIGHVPGAVNVPFDSFRSEAHASEGSDEGAGETDEGAGETDEGDDDASGAGDADGAGDGADGTGRVGMLPAAETWESLLGSAGIAPDDALVAYDDTHGVFAARFLVTALLFGHRDLHLLNGDFSSWMRAHETSTEAPDPTPVDYAMRDPERSPLIDAAGVEAAVESDAVVVDTRSPEEFAEGRIPGAVNLDWLELVDDESRGLKSAEELRALLSERGITPDRRVVLYCNTARRISHTFVVLSWLGYEDVKFYEGSLTEWLAEDRAVEAETQESQD